MKTLSFLTYLLRGFAELMKPFEDAISKAVIQLLAACPGDAVATRKELLVATRHILATDFRRGFFSQVDVLLDEKVLVGVGRLSHEARCRARQACTVGTRLGRIRIWHWLRSSRWPFTCSRCT